MRFFCVSLLVLCPVSALAEAPDEAAMFGGEATPAPAPPPAKPAAESLTWGGALELGAESRFLVDDDVEQGSFSGPLRLSLFADGRPDPKVRAFARLRISSDLAERREPGSEDFFTDLAEAWVKADVAETVFLTAGRQPLKWGSCRFWNPTDFLYPEGRDPFASEDRRTGLPLLKIHVPFEKSGANLYAVANFADAERLRQVLGAVRSEVLVGSAELAFTAAARSRDVQKAGVDLSWGVGDFDVRAEIAARRKLGDDASGWKTRMAAGIEYTLSYGENDSAILGTEWFRNENGARRPEDYPEWLLTGQGQPLELGRNYAAAWLHAADPWSLVDQSFTLTLIENLDDETWMARADVAHRIVSGGTLALFASWNGGPRGGEFLPRMAPMIASEAVRAQAGARLTVAF